ncbi:MAG: hypothetical protein LBI01_06540 [Elusimicrobium sp.]|jgi:hypothetical protein|nr:hypothetical protein [Elusimicrobium sp.]
MKIKILPVCFLILFCAPDNVSAAVHIKDFDKNRDKFLIDKIIDNQEITYCLHADKALFYESLPASMKNYRREALAPAYQSLISTYQGLIADAFKTWTTGIAAEIKKSGREKEFEDIMSILNRGVKLKYGGECDIFYLKNDISTPWKPFDISIYIEKTLCKNEDKPGAAFFAAEPFPYICLSRLEPADIVAHEAGHALGLGDHYDDGAYLSSIGSYGTIQGRPALMKEEDYITCDDADAMITLIDRADNKDRTFKSLCSDGIVFKYGFQQITKKETQFLKYSKKEKVLATFYPFSVVSDNIYSLDYESAHYKNFSGSKIEKELTDAGIIDADFAKQDINMLFMMENKIDHPSNKKYLEYTYIIYVKKQNLIKAAAMAEEKWELFGDGYKKNISNTAEYFENRRLVKKAELPLLPPEVKDFEKRFEEAQIYMIKKDILEKRKKLRDSANRLYSLTSR